ncbi:hypothetical protein BOTBODRAFT_179848 [Botryobasidium botryosum FD-172 SS1]|uniref:Uncharacterized protein n=1 Tax=Botryobasidium botryosum (strain FD-172 SS1) TaxID=930990 RepID=A0A067MA73_BOTB1|nr:hypothetical protein BOTBODRAFT_179848 [Botryobasidium botryosum FD-172 SS1]
MMRPTYRAPALFYVYQYADAADCLLFALGIVNAIISGAAFPILDFINGLWTNGIASQGPDSPHLHGLATRTALACFAVGIVQLVASFTFLTSFTIAATRCTARLRRAYLSSALHQDATYFDRVGPGEIGTRIVKDMNTIRTAAGERIAFLVWAASTLIISIIISFTRAPHVAAVLISIVPIGFGLFYAAGHLSFKASHRTLSVEDASNTFLEQVLSTIRIVQAFGAESDLIAIYDAYLRRLQKLGARTAFIHASELAITYGIINLLYSFSFWYGGIAVTKASVPIGSLFTCFWNYFDALYAIVEILPHISAVIECIGIQARVRDEIERMPTIDVRDPSGKRFSPSEPWDARIDFINVDFSYPSRGHFKALDGLNLIIPSGKVTAIVGASGSGKSTIASLLLRYYDPGNNDVVEDDESKEETEHGCILLAGLNLDSYNLSWLRSQIAIVSQDPQIFTATILENVALGLTGTELEYDPEESDEARKEQIRQLCIDALRKAQAWDFVSNLPQGIDTEVTGARAGVLSGGQKQRIAAARALIRRPKILILDEGTSALDSETESHLMEAIHAEQRETGMTTILIAHRLSTIQSADKIAVMSEGRIVEEGTYDSLVAQEGAFQALVNHQLSVGDDSPPSRAPPVPTAPSIRPDLPDASHTDIRTMTSTMQSTLVNASNDSLEKGEIVPPLRREDSQNMWIRLWGYLQKQRYWFLGGSVAALIVGGSFSFSAWLIGQVVDSFTIQGDNHRLRSEVNVWSLWFLGMAIVDIALCLVSGYLLENGAQKLARVLRLRSVEALLKQEVGFFDKKGNTAGALTAAVASHTSNISTLAGLVWFQILACSGDILGGFLLAFILNWKMAIISFLPFPIVFLAVYHSVVQLEQYEEEQEESLENASSFAAENIDNIKTVAALGREQAVLKTFDREIEQNKASPRRLYIGTLGFSVGNGSFLLMGAIAIGWGTRLFSQHAINLATLYATFECVLVANNAVGRVFPYIPDIARAFHSFRLITRWELRKPRVAQLPSSSGEKPTELRGNFEFTNCTLRYPDRFQPVLDGLNLKILAGQSVAFCGPSGGGKSTILALLNRFYDPDLGTITMGGVDIRSIPLNDYRSAFALVSQDAVLYEGTIRQNILIGITRDVHQEELEQACRDAFILEFIQSLPDTFDTNIGLKGAQLSGGQQQRLCLARALLRNPKVLLLDEATSALDAESEQAVQEALERTSHGRTTIFVAHRLSTVRNANVIHVVDEGRIVESGKHADLLALKGRYYELVKLQL